MANTQRENKNRPPHKKGGDGEGKHAPSPHGDGGGHHRGAQHVPPHVEETPPEVWPDPDWPAPGRAPSEELSPDGEHE